MAPSTLRARGLSATDVTVIDLSRTGLRLSTSAALTTGDEISIGLPGVGARRAYVAWQREHHYGCVFECPLEAGEAQEAFAGASVVRLGTPAQAQRAALAGDNAELQALYGTHSAWHIPLDAAIAIGSYCALFAWLAWRFVLS